MQLTEREVSDILIGGAIGVVKVGTHQNNIGKTALVCLTENLNRALAAKAKKEK